MFYVIVGVSQSVIQVEDVAQGHLQGEPLAHRGPRLVSMLQTFVASII
jgi:hypothetical protein